MFNIFMINGKTMCLYYTIFISTFFFLLYFTLYKILPIHNSESTFTKKKFYIKISVWIPISFPHTQSNMSWKDYQTLFNQRTWPSRHKKFWLEGWVTWTCHYGISGCGPGVANLPSWAFWMKAGVLEKTCYEYTNPSEGDYSFAI